MPEDADAGMILAFLDNFKGDRVWVRACSSQGIPDKADSDGFMAVPK